MRYTYTSGYENFKLAQRTYNCSSPRRRVLFHLQMWGFLVIGLLLLILFSSYPELRDRIPVGVMAGLIGGLVGGGIVGPLMRPLQIRRSYTIYNGPPKLPLPVYLEVEGDTLISGIEGKSEGRFQRSAICDTAEDDTIMLLFLGKKKFLYLPKAALPAEAMIAVREWLALPGAPAKC